MKIASSFIEIMIRCWEIVKSMYFLSLQKKNPLQAMAVLVVVGVKGMVWRL